MRRRTALRLGATGVAPLLAGCASLQGPSGDRAPKSYRAYNDTSRTVTLRVSVSAVRDEAGDEASHETLSSRTFELGPKATKTGQWPETAAETYQIKGELGDGRWSALSFDPDDWNGRSTPVVRVSEKGVTVFIE